MVGDNVAPGVVAPAGSEANRRLADRAEAVAAFKALEAYDGETGVMRLRCRRPFGRDYMTLGI